MNTLPAETDVLIVGAGPTGLTLACVLATKGVSFVLLERRGESSNTSRAGVVHARTLEALEGLNITNRLRAEGHVVPRFVLRDRDRVLATVNFADLPTRYPYTLMIPQSTTERILLERLLELDGDVHRPYELTDIQQHHGSATAVVTSAEGTPHAIRARYVVGTDGMHSTVRKLAGIGFTGDSYEQSFVLADVRMRWGLSNTEVFLFLSPDGLVVVAPLPGGLNRVVATVDEAPEQPDLEDVQHLLDTRGPMRTAARVDEIVWSSRFRVHHRVADEYRRGNVLLAGDAAHVHSPAGGQGMNTGIQDATALGQMLAAVICGGAPENLLNDYERIRRPVAERVVAFTDRMTRMATLRAAPARVLRNAAIGIMGRVPAIERWLATELSGLRNRANAPAVTKQKSQTA